MRKKSLLSLLLSGMMIFASICPASASQSATQNTNTSRTNLAENNTIYKVTSSNGASSKTMHQTGTDSYYQVPQTAYLTP